MNSPKKTSDNDQGHLELAKFLEDLIIKGLRKELGNNTIGISDCSNIYVYSQTLTDDPQNLSSKVKVVYKNRPYYIALPGEYYTRENSLSENSKKSKRERVLAVVSGHIHRILSMLRRKRK